MTFARVQSACSSLTSCLLFAAAYGVMQKGLEITVKKVPHVQSNVATCVGHCDIFNDN